MPNATNTAIAGILNAGARYQDRQEKTIAEQAAEIERLKDDLAKAKPIYAVVRFVSTGTVGEEITVVTMLTTDPAKAWAFVDTHPYMGYNVHEVEDGDEYFCWNGAERPADV